MRTLRFAALAGALAAALPAQAQEAAAPLVCASYETHARYLADKFGEFPVFSGAVEQGVSLQLFVNRSSGSWTALLVRADGVSCVTSAGENGRPEVGL